MKKHRLIIAKAPDAFKAADKLGELIRAFEKKNYEVGHFAMMQTGPSSLNTAMAAVMVRDDKTAYSDMVRHIDDLEKRINAALKLMDCEDDCNRNNDLCDWWDGHRCRMLAALRGNASGELQHCGHERRFVVSGDGGTNWCALCELEGQKARYGLGSKEPD